VSDEKANLPLSPGGSGIAPEVVDRVSMATQNSNAPGRLAAAIYSRDRKPLMTFHLSMGEVEALIASHLKMNPAALVCSHEIREDEQWLAVVILS
jgi:hypothetical protein